MKNSKRVKNQKKKLSRVKNFRKQRGSSDPPRTNDFHVYFNYINDDDSVADRILSRQLNSNELELIRADIFETRGVLIDNSKNQVLNLEIDNIVQLTEPYNGKYFRLILTINNLSNKDALLLILDFMHTNSLGEIQFIKAVGENIYRSEDDIYIENATGTERWGAKEQETLLNERFQRIVIERGQLHL